MFFKQLKNILIDVADVTNDMLHWLDDKVWAHNFISLCLNFTYSVQGDQ